MGINLTLKHLNWLSFLGLVIITAAISACTNAKPEINELSQLDGLSFSPSEISVSQVSAITVSGQCDARLQQIEISYDNGKTWTNLTQADPAAKINCASSQTFSTSLSPSQTQLSSSQLSSAGKPTYSFLFHGISSFAMTKAAELTVVKTSVDSRLASFFSASSSQSSNSYKMKSRISFNANGSQSSQSYKIKSTVSFK